MRDPLPLYDFAPPFGPAWKLPDGRRHIHLLTPGEVRALPRPTLLWSIAGDAQNAGLADLDTRGGYTAWGFICTYNCTGVDQEF